MKLSIQALYTLHLFNDFSDDLPFLPLPIPEGMGRKKALQEALHQGYEELGRLELMKDGQPTEECLLIGQTLREYHQASYHCRIDHRLAVAPKVDSFGRMCVLIRQVDEKNYQVERHGSILLLSTLIASHEFLQNVDDTLKDYVKTDWEAESFFRLYVLDGQSPALRIECRREHDFIEDSLYYLKEDHIYEFDMVEQRERSIDSEVLKTLIIKKLEVTI